MPAALPSIFIVGPMGAGKTTVGRLLAKHLNRPFVDSDHYIEERTGADIPWIFEKEGEAGFRRRETRALKILTAKPDLVLATGGGAVMRPKNREYLKTRGITIYLQTSVDVQLKRTAKDNSRPLLNTENPRQVLKQLYEKRHPLYLEVADITLTTGNGFPRHMLNKVLAALDTYMTEVYCKVHQDANEDS